MAETALVKFVHALLRGGEARREGEQFVHQVTGRRAPADAIGALVSSGALAGDRESCRATDGTASWLKRARLERDAFQAQHRLVAPGRDGAEINLAESPLVRLASGASPFLDRHHLEAGERVRRLVERAQLRARVTMTYSAARIAGSGISPGADIPDMAVDARRALDEVRRVLPSDCAGVVLDVCGLLKGLQDVERERGWPRRSAKLVLRIGLDRLAEHFGLAPAARGKAQVRQRGWMEDGARPMEFGPL